MLGALLLVVIVLLWSCTRGGSDDPGRKPGAAGSSTPSSREIPADPSGAASPNPGGPPAVGGNPVGDPAAQPTPTNVPVAGAPGGSPVPAAPTGTAAAGAQDGACTDAEMLVVPTPTPTSAPRGQNVQLRLAIKNQSARTCSRDVGAALQEIYIKQGARTIWSSDACGTARDSSVQPFGPGAVREFWITWNGRESGRCEGGAAAGPVPVAGDYELMGRLGSRLSNPVKLTLTG